MCTSQSSLGTLDVAVAWMSAQPKHFARFFGLRPAASSGVDSVEQPQAPSRWAERVAKWRGRFRELVLLYLMGCAVSQLINENKSIPKLTLESKKYGSA